MCTIKLKMAGSAVCSGIRSPQSFISTYCSPLFALDYFRKMYKSMLFSFFFDFYFPYFDHDAFRPTHHYGRRLTVRPCLYWTPFLVMLINTAYRVNGILATPQNISGFVTAHLRVKSNQIIFYCKHQRDRSRYHG